MDLINLPWTTVLHYPHHDDPHVQKTWTDGKHPAECTGKCNLNADGGILRCSGCSMDEWSLY